MSNSPQDVLKTLESLRSLFAACGFQVSDVRSEDAVEALELAIRAVTEMCFDSAPQQPHHPLIRGRNVEGHGIPTSRRHSPVIVPAQEETGCMDGPEDWPGGGRRW